MIRVITNDEDSGDYVVILKDDKIIHSGHSLSVYDFAKLCGVEVESVSDDEINSIASTTWGYVPVERCIS